MTSRSYSVREIAEALGVTRKSAHQRALRESWPYEESTGRGGKRRLFEIESLPSPVRRSILAWEKSAAACAENTHRLTVLETEESIARARAEDRQRKSESALADMVAGLTQGQRQRFDARLAIVHGWEVWFAQSQPIGKRHGAQLFSEQYNDDSLPPLADITAAVREAIPSISARSLERWHGAYLRNGMAGLIDANSGKKLKELGIFVRQPALKNACLKILTSRPNIKLAHLHEVLADSAIDRETGEVLFEAPTYNQTYRFVRDWQEANPELLLAATNPDAWKDRCMSAVGNASEDVTALNQRWEMDATPADWMLIDPETGKRRRYTCSAVIDVYSRRMLFVLSRTPRAQTHMYALRLALLAWGVPKEIVTDNGQDYKAGEFRLALEALDIKQHVTNPFSPWEKPHVERGIGAMLNSVLELLPQFLGHNVAERQAIESKKAFSQRLFKKDSEVELDMTPQQLQEHIDNWVKGVHEQRAHGGTGETPFERAANWTGQVRTIQDERALDILLAPFGGKPTLQKKGLRIEKGWYASVELFDQVEVGTQVEVRQTEDFGTVLVYQEGRFIGPAICPERKGISRKELASHIRATQAKRVQRDKRDIKRASTIDPDQLAARLVREKAQAAGKLSTLPRRGDTVHHSQGLTEAARADERMTNGKQSRPLSPELQRRLDAKKTAVETPAQPANVAAIPEQPTIRFKRWMELNDTVENGGLITDPKLLRWYGTYPQTSEFQQIKRRHEAARKAAEKANEKA